MKKLTPLALLCLALFSFRCEASGQQPKAKPPQSQTKLELFQEKTGSVIVRNFTEIGHFYAALSGTVTVTSWEFIDAQTGKKEYGISVAVKESGTLEREDRAFVDYDEIPSLLKGIDYISAIDKTVTKLQNFQADYRTTGDLQVSTFTDSKGKIQAVVKVGRIGAASAYIDLKNLAHLRQFIVDAQAALDAIK
jgi:hypothetical protein